MQRSDDGNVRLEITKIADGHFCVILDREVEVHEAVDSDSCMAAVMKAYRAEHKRTRPDFPQQFVQNPLPCFAVLFKKIVEFLAQSVRITLYGAADLSGAR